MTPDEFIRKWTGVTLKERSAAQEHFLDLCRLLEQPTPAEADPTGEWYCFERGASKAGGGDGWADVWKRGCFGWEYKGPGKDLERAFKQLQLYTPALEYPPLLIVSDIERIIVHTAFTGTVPQVHQTNLEDLRDHAVRRRRSTSRCLVGVAEAINDKLREEAILGRVGGDEFFALVPNLPSTDQAEEVKNRIEAAVGSVVVTCGDGERSVTASVGLALYPLEGTDFPQLERIADQRMYEAKTLKRGTRAGRPETQS